MNEEPTHGKAMVTIHEEGGPEALELVANLMARNAHDQSWLMEQLYEGEKRRGDQLQEEVNRLHDRLDLIAWRHDFLLGRVHTPFPEVFS